MIYVIIDLYIGHLSKNCFVYNWTRRNKFLMLRTLSIVTNLYLTNNKSYSYLLELTLSVSPGIHSIVAYHIYSKYILCIIYQSGIFPISRTQYRVQGNTCCILKVSKNSNDCRPIIQRVFLTLKFEHIHLANVRKYSTGITKNKPQSIFVDYETTKFRWIYGWVGALLT